jgi:hypothetical protein
MSPIPLRHPAGSAHEAGGEEKMEILEDLKKSEYLSLLRSCDLFAGFSEMEFACICTAMKPTLQKYLKNEIVLSAGSRSDKLGIVGAGRLVKIKIYNGREEHLISVEARGDLIGLEGAASSLRTNPFMLI